MRRAPGGRGHVSQLQPSRPLREQLLALDLRSLGLLRICYGALLLLDLGGRAGDLRAHYTDWGIAPRNMVEQLASSWPSPCLHALSGGMLLQVFLFTVHAIAALALMLGFRTRYAGPICWFLLCSLHSRNPLICDGGDNYLRVILFWCLFLPWGARLALRPDPEPKQSRLAAFAYLFQLSCIYWFAVALKTGTDWSDGSAVYYTLSIDQLATPAAHWLLQKPAWMQFLTHFTVWVEIIAPLLLWLPGWPRLLGIVSLASLHLGFALFMNLGLFPWIGMVSCWGLLPSRIWASTPDYAPSERKQHFWLLLYPMALVLQWNVLGMGLFRPRYILWDLPLKFLRLDQSWAMFAPRPRREDGWYVIEADREDGTQFDLSCPETPLSWEKPALIAHDYPNSHWRRYMMTIYFPEAAAWRQPYGRYLTRRWNESHPAGQRIKAFRIYFMLEVTGQPVRKTLLWTHDCQVKS